MKPYYEHGGITIYHGDCREVLPELEPVDLVLTDPPYGIAHKSHGQTFKRAREVRGDDSTDLILWLLEVAGKVPMAMFFSPYAYIDWSWRSILVWHKGAHVGIGGDRGTCWKRTFELIGVANNRPLNGTRDDGVLSVPALLPPPSGHVAEKPEALMRYLVEKLSCAEHIIFDPFMGSGTTLRAAKDLGRRAIGIEIEERYCEIAAKRLGQEVLFTGDGTPPTVQTERDLFAGKGS